ncbi:MAG: PAS domain-containing protein [Rhodospirillales bacterium]
MRPNTPISLNPTLTVSDVFKSPVTQRLLDYWREKAGDRPRPAWRDFKLMDIYDIASCVTVRDVVDGGREFRSRYCGTHVVSILGVELTGKLLSETYSAAGAAMMSERYHLVMRSDMPVRIVSFIRVVEKNLPTGYECIILPLSGQDGTVGHLVSAFDFNYIPEEGEATRP